MAKLHMDLIENVNFIHVIGMASIVISAIVHFILVVILQLVENGLKVKTFGTVKIATGYMKKNQLNV